MRKLTENPSSVTDADAQAVYDAGWSEKTLHDAIMVVCCFNFMNRLLEGHGIHGHAAGDDAEVGSSRKLRERVEPRGRAPAIERAAPNFKLMKALSSIMGPILY